MVPVTCPVCTHIDETGWTGLPTGTGHCSDNPRLHIVGCHAEYRGRQVHMADCCHQTFGGDSTERDFHQFKSRCRTPDELLAVGLVNRDGVWSQPPPDRTLFGRKTPVAGADPAIP